MKKIVLTLTVAMAAGSAFAAGNPEAGSQKAATCIACHMIDGNSVNPIWPKLAEQDADYLAKQLAAFKSGARKDDTMAAMTAPLSPEDMADLSAYFSTKERTIGSADPAKAKVGQQIYRAGVPSKQVAACSGCHGPAGAGNPPADFPSLSGQHADYVKKALSDFRAGVRTTDPNGMMRDVAARMSDDEIEAVAQYVQGLH